MASQAGHLVPCYSTQSSSLNHHWWFLGRQTTCQWSTGENSKFFFEYLLPLCKIYILSLVCNTLEYCDGFCHVATWISHRYTYVRSLLYPFPPPSPPPHSSRLSQNTGFGLLASLCKLPLSVYFTDGNVYISMLFSQIIPPSPSFTVSQSLFFMSVFPLLPCI